MSIEIIKVSRVKCDKCEIVFVGEGEHIYFEEWEDMADILNCEDWLYEDGRVLCSACRFDDDEEASQ